MDSESYDEAVKHFSTILLLDQVDQIDFLIKRGKARASMKLWDDALRDADEVYVASHCLSDRSMTERAGYQTRPVMSSGLRDEACSVTRGKTLHRGG